MNVGPTELEDILAIVTRIEKNQGDMLAEINTLKNDLPEIDGRVNEFADRMTIVEGKIASTKASQRDSAACNVESNKIAMELSKVNARCDD